MVYHFCNYYWLTSYCMCRYYNWTHTNLSSIDDNPHQLRSSCLRLVSEKIPSGSPLCEKSFHDISNLSSLLSSANLLLISYYCPHLSIHLNRIFRWVNKYTDVRHVWKYNKFWPKCLNLAWNYQGVSLLKMINFHSIHVISPVYSNQPVLCR